MSEHTPAPWTAHQQEPDSGAAMVEGPIIRGADDELVAEVLSTDERATADTALIASAPTMYEALHHLVTLLEPLEQRGTLNVPGLATLNGARAALDAARATP